MLEEGLDLGNRHGATGRSQTDSPDVTVKDASSTGSDKNEEPRKLFLQEALMALAPENEPAVTPEQSEPNLTYMQRLFGTLCGTKRKAPARTKRVASELPTKLQELGVPELQSEMLEPIQDFTRLIVPGRNGKPIEHSSAGGGAHAPPDSRKSTKKKIAAENKAQGALEQLRCGHCGGVFKYKRDLKRHEKKPCRTEAERKTKSRERRTRHETARRTGQRHTCVKCG